MKNTNCKFSKIFFSVNFMAFLFIFIIYCIVSTAHAQSSGKALDFHGENEYVEISDHASLRLTDEFTIEAWVKLEIVTSDHFVIVQKGTDYELSINDESLVCLTGTLDGVYQNWMISTTKIKAGIWYHIAGSFGSAGAKIYINGTEDNATSQSGMINVSSGSVKIGGNTQSYDGQIDELRIWNKTLDAACIRDWMHKRITSDHHHYTNLSGYWKFDDGTGSNTVTDLSSNNNHGTLKNMDPSTDWVISTMPFASNMVENLTDVKAVWVSLNSNTSSMMTIRDKDISGSDATIFGHNNEKISLNTSDVPEGINRRLNRVWRLEKNGGALSGDIIIACTNFAVLNGNNLRLLIDDDGNFSNAEVVTGSYNIPNFMVSDLMFENGKYYTLASTGVDISVHPEFALPVELAYFNVSELTNESAVELRWRTESERNNIFWFVQRKSNADETFEIIKRIDGQVTTSTATEYHFIDKDVVAGEVYTYRLADMSKNGKITYHLDRTVTVSVPRENALLQNYPNPFNPTTRIVYKLPVESKVNLTIYNLLGQQVASLINDSVQNAGIHYVNWDGRDEQDNAVPGGVYIYALDTGKLTTSKRMVLMK